jgi:hypothetical protein
MMVRSNKASSLQSTMRRELFAERVHSQQRAIALTACQVDGTNEWSYLLSIVEPIYFREISSRLCQIFRETRRPSGTDLLW